MNNNHFASRSSNDLFTTSTFPYTPEKILKKFQNADAYPMLMVWDS